MKYLLGYKIQLEPRKFGKLMSLWHKLKAILRKTMSIETVIKVQVHINGEPTILHREFEARAVSGGIEIDFDYPFLIRDTDTVELKVQNLSETAKAKVELIMVEPSLYQPKPKEGVDKPRGK